MTRSRLLLFIGGTAPACATSSDMDDSGRIDLSDAIFLAQFLFLGGPPPSAPFPDCGHDPTPDNLSCERYGACFNPPPP